MVQIRGPRGRRVKENTADEVEDEDSRIKKKRGVKPLFRRMRGSVQDAREPTSQGADSDQYPEQLAEQDEEVRDSAPSPASQSPTTLPRTPSLRSTNSIASKGSLLTRRKSSTTSVGTNDKSVEVVLQEEETSKPKKSPWFPRARQNEDAHENHRLPPTESACSVLSQPTDGDEAAEAVEAVDASAAVVKDKETDVAEEIYQVNLTPALLTGLVAPSKQTNPAMSVQCYVRIVSEVHLVDDCPGIVRSLPYQLDMGSEDKKRGEKYVVVLWPNDTLISSIGTISFRTTEAGIQAFGGLDLEIGVESKGELQPLGSTTLYLDGDEVDEENVTLKINATPSPKSPKRLKRLFRVGSEKKSIAGASLDENALFSIGLHVTRIAGVKSPLRTSPPVNSASPSSPWLQAGSPPLFNMIFKSFSKDPTAESKVEKCISEEKTNVVAVQEQVFTGQFSCCSGFDDDEYIGENEGTSTGQSSEQLMNNTQGINQAKSAKSSYAGSEKIEKTIHRTLCKAHHKAETTISRDRGGLDMDDETYDQTFDEAFTEMDEAALVSHKSFSDVDGWSMSPTGASMVICSVFSCCFGNSIADESVNISPLKSKSPLSLNGLESINIANSKQSVDSVDGSTIAYSVDLSQGSNDETMNLSALMNGSNPTTDGLEETGLCSSCCSPCGSNAEDFDHQASDGEDEIRAFDFKGMDLSKSSLTQQHMLGQEGMKSIPGGFEAHNLSNQDFASINNVSPRRENHSIEISKAELAILDGEVESIYSKPDARANFCWQCCGEEDVANISPLPERNRPVNIDTQIADAETPLVANFCMTCLGDEDISRIRIVSSNISPASRSMNASSAIVNSPKSSYQAPTSYEDPLQMKMMDLSTKDVPEAAGIKPARAHVEVDFSSSSGSEEASLGQRISAGSSTGISLYSNENERQERWFPFFGVFDGTKTGSDCDEQSALSSRYSSETESSSYFSRSTRE